jgi:hypothetical protein
MGVGKEKQTDFVITAELKKGKYSFSYEEITHLLLGMYLHLKEAYLNAEERQLVCIAIT